jgi:transcriptional regulator with XRE-family HTH domain
MPKGHGPRPDPVIGKHLQRVRLLRGWSQVEVARRAGLTNKTVCRIETGQSANAVSLRKVCTVFGLTLEAVLQELGHPLLGPARRQAAYCKDWIKWTDGQAFVRQLRSAVRGWPRLQLRVACDPPVGAVRVAIHQICAALTRWQGSVVTPTSLADDFQLGCQLGDALRALAPAGWELVGRGAEAGPDQPEVAGSRWWAAEWSLELRPVVSAPAASGPTL